MQDKGKIAAEEMQGSPNPIDVERFNVSHFTVLASNMELGILCGGSIPAVDERGVVGLGIAPKAYLSMSPVAAKELAALLTTYVSQFELTNGKLTSEYLDSLARRDA